MFNNINHLKAVKRHGQSEVSERSLASEKYTFLTLLPHKLVTMKKMTLTASMPLAELFRVNFHGELRTVIESWRPYLVGDNPDTDALAMTRFEFDKKRIYSNRVYYDLLDLDALGALQVPLSLLARYLADHTNLSRSHATLYRQLKKYRQERP